MSDSLYGMLNVPPPPPPQPGHSQSHEALESAKAQRWERLDRLMGGAVLTCASFRFL